MKKEPKQHRQLQKFILAISLMIVAIGIYLIIIEGAANFLTLGMRTSEPPTTKHQPFLFLFIVALVLVFFTARNLFRRK